MRLWIARNNDDSLTLFGYKPFYNELTGFWYDVFEMPIADDLDSTLFPEVTFNNSPQEIELKIRND